MATNKASHSLSKSGIEHLDKVVFMHSMHEIAIRQIALWLDRIASYHIHRHSSVRLCSFSVAMSRWCQLLASIVFPTCFCVNLFPTLFMRLEA